MKLLTVKKDMTIQDYILQLIKIDLAKHDSDKTEK